MPQFSLYAKEAHQQKVYQLNLKNVDEYLNQIFGKGKKNKIMEEDDPNNFVWAIKKAKEGLMKETGRKEFKLPEVWDYINKNKIKG